MGIVVHGRGDLIMAKTSYAARAEARKLSVKYGLWYVVRSQSGEYYTMAFAPDRMDGAPRLVATYINGKQEGVE